MTLKEFKDKLLELDLPQLRTIYSSNTQWSECLKYDPVKYRKYDAQNYKPYDALFVEWSTGGITGGNCWGGENYGYSTGNSPEELTDLDVILTHFRPNTTFLEHRKLTQELTKTSTRSEGEYYGNSTDYTYRYILIDELHRRMEGMGWLTP